MWTVRNFLSVTYLCLVGIFKNSPMAIVSEQPCEEVVKYVEKQEDRWFAEIHLKDTYGIEGVWLNITLDRDAQLLTNKFGPSKSTNNRNFLIIRHDINLLPNEDYPVKIMAKYNAAGIVPAIISVLLNGRKLCPVPISAIEAAEACLLGSRYGTSGQASKLDVDAADGKFPKRLPPEGSMRTNVLPVDVSKICGTVVEEQNRITRGDLSGEGQFPWMLAMMEISGIFIQYTCSANLITQRFALTAGHCVVKNDGPRNPQQFILQAGSVNLTTNSENLQIYQLRGIYAHPNYTMSLQKNDIAVLELATLADITGYVRPVCLWESGEAINTLYNKTGIVAGWGYTETGHISTQLRHALLPIVAPETCIFSDSSFYSHFISPQVFCVGYNNGTSVCQGDSGAALAINKKGRYYARGLVSLSKSIFGMKCDSYNYAIFTDIVPYLPWVKSIIE